MFELLLILVNTVLVLYVPLHGRYTYINTPPLGQAPTARIRAQFPPNTKAVTE